MDRIFPVLNHCAFSAVKCGELKASVVVMDRIVPVLNNCASNAGMYGD